HEHVRRLTPEMPSDTRGDRFDRSATATAGKGVAVARVDHQGPRPTKHQCVPTPFDFRRWAFAGGGDASDGGAFIQRDEGEIAAIPILVLRAGHADGHAGDW